MLARGVYEGIDEQAETGGRSQAPGEEDQGRGRDEAKEARGDGKCSIASDQQTPGRCFAAHLEPEHHSRAEFKAASSSDAPACSLLFDPFPLVAS